LKPSVNQGVAGHGPRSGLVHWPPLKAWSEEEDEVLSPANLVGRDWLRRSFASGVESDAMEQIV
jgi:hypothetical protein